MKSLLTLFLFTHLLLFTYGQGNYNLCMSVQSTDTAGNFYDSGGPFGTYLTNEDCTFLIAPPCAISITITFSQFKTEMGYDELKIYDGDNINAPLLLVHSGDSIPPTVYSTSGFILIVWHSDVSSVDDGFAAQWTSISTNSPGNAAISISDTTPAFNHAVHFADSSVGIVTNWQWDFGDGTVSSLQNPDHVYTDTGSFNVSLIIQGCFGSDTSSHSLYVQCPATASVPPDSFYATVCRGSQATFDFDIINVSGCELAYDILPVSNSDDTVRLLAMIDNVDPFREFPNTIDAVRQHFSKFTLQTTLTSSPTILASLLLNNIDVLLIPEQEIGNGAYWIPFAPVIQQFLSQGGSVIWLGSLSVLSQGMFSTGVWSGHYDSTVTSTIITIVNPSHPLADSLPLFFPFSNATYPCVLTNSDKVSIAKSDSADIFAYRYHNGGKAIFLAYDFYDEDANNSLAIANAVRWAGDRTFNWVHPPPSGIVNTGDTTTVSVTFETIDLFPGTYSGFIQVTTSDTSNPVTLLPYTIVVDTNDVITFSDSCIHFTPVFQNYTDTGHVTFFYSACDTLYIDSVYTDAAEFTFLNQPPQYLTQGDSISFDIAFISPLPGTYYGSIHIENSVKDTVICMRAESIFDSTVSVKNIFSEDVSVFPNPASMSITISTGAMRDCKIKLIDVYGNCLREIPAFDKLTYINLENFFSGIYFLVIESEAGRRVIKLLKQ